ncbi:MAG TPA: FHA domain-containing protein [Kofleriaceae bacterium]|nr:FHA domain-containing protein [Kofleriaceae bacterium]
MPLRLSFDSGPLAGIHIVTSAQTIRLGRDPGQNDILLTNPKVSRKHAVIERSVRGGYSLEVMGSGPSKLNGDPISAVGGRSAIHQLASGDRLDFGGVELSVAEAEVKLIATTGSSAGRECSIDGPARIGSSPDCDLVIDESGVAPEHVIITSTPLGFRADAQAPVLFNGQQTDSRVLAHGDELIIGQAIVRFTVAAQEDFSGPESSMTNMTVIGKIPVATNAVGELIFIAGAAKGERIPLGDEQIILGTRADCTMVLSDLLASPIHCAISKSGDQFVATDLGSEAGTYINGERIFQGTALKPGDLIAVGSHVLEARLIGGVAIATKGNTIFTTMSAAGIQDLGPQPRFVLDGRVVKARKIVIGRAPSCDVIVDGPAVSREHCVLEWAESGFVVRDTSSAGTYLDDKRIVQTTLPPTCVLRVVDTLFRIAVRGEVCTLERTDALLAQAAVDVARQHASMLTRGIQVANVPQMPGASQFMVREGMRTIFKMDVGQLEQEIAARKKDIRKGAPAWRPSSDLQGDRAMRGTVVLSVLAAIALCGGAVLLGRGKALVNHPLSPAHSSTKFTDQVSQKGGGATVCGACHTAGAQVNNSTCVSCHESFKTRGKKHTQKAHDGQTCDSCHKEHQTPEQADKALFARESCDTCHPNQHADDFKSKGTQQLDAGAIPNKPELDPGNPENLTAFHQAHARVKLGKVEHGIGCNACHSNVDDKGAMTEARALMSCYRCHERSAAGQKINCGSCHGTEHVAKLERASTPPEIVIDPPNPITSVGWAAGIALVGISPGLLFGAWLRVRRRRATSAMVEQLKSHPAEVVKRLVHSINDSKCVGCNMCVQACPASVLELVDHKSRVVNFDSCIQCKKCEKACAFDALRMHDADKPPPMIAMPSIDAFHETPVQGMFLVGQASGTPQVKNATNLGRACVQRMLQQGFRPGAGRQAGAEYDVVIVGSGPAGLSAALTCVELGLSYVVLEKERAFSWTIRNYYHKGKEVMAEPHDVALEATLPHWDSSREELLGAWEELVNQYRIDIRYQQNVVDVKKEGERFAVQVGDGKNPPNAQFTCARVVIAIGTLGNPRKLGVPGDDLEKVKNSLVDPDEWRGKNILVIGGSDSAVEVVLALSRPELGNRVWYSTRGAKLEGIKPKNRKLIEEALAAGRFESRYATTAAEVTQTTVAITHTTDGRREDLPNDVIFAMIGGNSPQKWLQQIGVPYVEKPHSWSPPRTDLLSQKTAEGLIPIKRLQRRPLPQRGHHH